MKIWIIALIGFLVACGTKKESPSTPDTSEKIKSDTIKKSIPKEELFQVGNASITIKYHSPGVKGRVIWGGLVPFDQVWVTGAHMATSFEVSENFEVDGKLIPAGKYALFTIPGKEEWTFIINKNWEQHLADEYDAKDDMVRIIIQPEYDQPHQERLTYEILPTSDQMGELMIRWEKTRLSIPLKFAKAK